MDGFIQVSTRIGTFAVSNSFPKAAFPDAAAHKSTATIGFASLAQNSEGKGAVGGFASGPASGPVRLELWQILIFWSFWIKPKGRRKKTDEGFSDGLIENITPRYISDMPTAFFKANALQE